jgi:hypothetical protein
MKRLISVLAIALILILTGWDDASSRRYADVRIDEPIYDHPWGGEQDEPDRPIGYSPTTTTITTVNYDLTIIGIIKTWNYKFFFSGTTFFNVGSRGTTTTTTTTTTTNVTEPGSSTNSSADQGGLGQ